MNKETTAISSKEIRDYIITALAEHNSTLLHPLIAANVNWTTIAHIIENEYKSTSEVITKLNQIAMLLHSISCDLECLQLLQYTLQLDPENSISLRHINLLCNKLNGPAYQMNIAIATNRRYVPVSLVMLYSLFFNNPDADINVYVLNCELNEEDEKAFQSLAAAWGQQITLTKITDMALFEGLPTTDAWTRETYFRLLMPLILPVEVERILYLDVDIIVNQSIREFYETDFNGMDFVVCEDILLNRAHKGYYQEHFSEMSGKDFTYFNAGVILWNLAQIRQNFSFDVYKQKLFEYLPVLQCLDQDILNVVHCQKTITEDWRKYNMPIPTAIQNHFSVEDVRQAAHIIHYLGPKPWKPDVEFHELYQIWKDYETLYKKDDLS